MVTDGFKKLREKWVMDKGRYNYSLHLIWILCVGLHRSRSDAVLHFCLRGVDRELIGCETVHVYIDGTAHWWGTHP
ncbi:hypothetical protein BDZ94DRAFT_1315896 [Collybia nuda]|uniref:Uncharacterized protein n=1 Tax=Collybia nuda TaxID=64659 RepID=A0A9P6CB53_9AGAR|nr:hypothetical protein BDZ94DRAFT_1315896 [Collybia nuda]